MRVKALFILILILSFGAAGYFALQQRLKLRPARLTPPRKLPDFQVANGRGEMQSLRTLIGNRVALILFVKPDCSYCRSQLSSLARLQKLLPEPSPITIVVEASGLSEAESADYETNFSPPFRICFDRGEAARKSLGISRLPCALIIDGAGAIKQALIGERDPDFLLKALDSFIHPAIVSASLSPVERLVDPALEVAVSGGVYLGRSQVVFQRADNDCGAAALKMVFDHYRIAGSLDELARKLIDHNETEGTSMLRLKEVAESAGLSAAGWRIAERDLPGVPLPSIVLLNRNHFVVLEAVDAGGDVIYADPAVGRVRMATRLFLQKSRGEMLIIRGKS